MKFTAMERANETEGDHRAETMRRVVAAGFALGVHGIFFAMLSVVRETPLALPEAPVPVKLVVLDIAPPAPAEAPPAPAETPKDTPPPIPEPLPKPEPISPVEPASIVPPPEPAQIETLQEPTPSAPPISLPLSILSTEDPQTGEAIPDRWRLPDGARIPLEDTQQPRNPNLQALSKALDCFGFDADCAVQRKAVFAEDQLTGTDLVWMRSYAHSGLSDSSLYGLSEAQIRERLGIPTAGKNGFMLLPGIGIDGPWWDALHGVNKSCEYGVGFNDDGQKQLMKRCASLRASSKDRIGFIPKPSE